MATQQLNGTPMRADHLTRPGRLLVEHDPGLGLGPSLIPLDEVRVDHSVTVTADITGLSVFPGRVRLILDDGHGGCGEVLVQSARFMAASRSLGRPIVIGDRVELHGTVVRRIDRLPKSLDAFAIRAVTA